MEKLEEEQTELIRKPLNENGVDVTEIENHGVIIINNSPDSIEVIKPNELFNRMLWKYLILLSFLFIFCHALICNETNCSTIENNSTKESKEFIQNKNTKTHKTSFKEKRKDNQTIQIKHSTNTIKTNDTQQNIKKYKKHQLIHKNQLKGSENNTIDNGIEEITNNTIITQDPISKKKKIIEKKKKAITKKHSEKHENNKTSLLTNTTNTTNSSLENNSKISLLTNKKIKEKTNKEKGAQKKQIRNEKKRPKEGKVKDQEKIMKKKFIEERSRIKKEKNRERYQEKLKEKLQKKINGKQSKKKTTLKRVHN
ncbi:Hypothetical protein EHI5A_031450 [Entamoeba histolytica KU27]|nr:Hypothetical protein EHI5A_031450 [Entamoeba histolytica KU27]